MAWQQIQSESYKTTIPTEQPDRSFKLRMGPKSTSLAILFADVSDSTKLYEALGDSIAQVLISDTLETIANIVTHYNGTVIKTIGDEIMCTFNNVVDAASAACAMHELLEDKSGPQGDPVTIRVGMHLGPAIMEGGDVFGVAVNIAARMVSQAKARQIMTTRSSVDLLPQIMQASTRFVDYAPIKGKQDDIEIYEILWQQEGVTRLANDTLPVEKKPSQVKLRLNYNGRDIVLDYGHSSIVLGRSHSCDLSVKDKLASRQHVRIELRREKFFIIDESTNGTHVRIDENGDTFLRREEMLLSGSGSISLGRTLSENLAELVHFTHEYS